MNIKLKTILFFWLLLLSALRVNAVPIEYGLSFNSHLCPGSQRTSLFLDDGNSFSVKDGLTLSFDMLVRENEPIFGSVLHFVTDDNQVIHFANVVDNGKNVPAFVYNDGMAVCHARIVTKKWQTVTFKIDAKKNKIDLNYGGVESSYTIPLNGTSGLKIQFGKREKYLADVAPFILKNVKVFVGGKLIRNWLLSKHNADICLDEKAGKPAKATNPLWILDNHIQWKTVLRKKISGLLGVAFNPNLMQFYLCNAGEVATLDKNGFVVKRQRVRGGYKANSKSNGFVAYDSRNDKLMSFSLSSGSVSYFSFENSQWSMKTADHAEAMHYNHSGVYNAADSSYYFFGGYGFYNYHNDLFRLRAGSDRVEPIKYTNSIPPRFGATMGVANGKLYIFGGRGNKQGKQAVESYFYNDLWSIDLKTHKAQLVWQRNSFPKGLLMATTMFYQPEKNAFYAMNVGDRGGTMYQVNIADTVITEVAKPIMNNGPYQDFEFNMFESPKEGRIYLVIDKILIDKSHDLAIYQLSTPLLSEDEISQMDMEKKHRQIAYWGCGLLLLLCIVSIAYFLVKNRCKKTKPKTVESNVAQRQNEEQYSAKPSIEEKAKDSFKGEVTESFKDTDESLKADVSASFEDDKEEDAQQEPTKYFDRTKSAVSLLGQFSVYDKEGNNITEQFTPRLKELFLLLVLYSEKKKHGVSVEKVTEIIWFDKKESAARNNRNVTLRKLRVLLEAVGNVEIVSSNGYLAVRWGKDIFCDYHTMMTYVKAYNDGEFYDSDEHLVRMLEILLYGPLLQGYETEWLDEFKDFYSSFSIDLLNKLLQQKTAEKDEQMVLRIAEILFLHDPLNEEALEAKCQVLCRQGKMGLAKRTYERFCKIYQDTLGENYERPFSSFAK